MAAVSFGTQSRLKQDKYIICQPLYCLLVQQNGYNQGAEFKVRETQRKSYDVDTRDIVRVRKHPGLTG